MTCRLMKPFGVIEEDFSIYRQFDYSERMLQTGIYPGRISGGRISQRSGEDPIILRLFA